MPVLNWIHHHKVLSAGGGVAIVLLVALGGLWFLHLRSPGTPVDLRQALLQYRQHRGGRLTAGILPPPGVHSFHTSGGEEISVAGIDRTFPAVSRMVVTDARCATIDWEPFEQHREEMVVCPTVGASLSMASVVTYEQIAGLQTTTRIHCSAGGYVVPPSSVGSEWRSTCHAPGQAITLFGRFLGTSVVVVGGHPQPAVHTRVTLAFTGSQTGTNPTDYWVSPTDGLILREQERVDIAQPVAGVGSVRFTEEMGVTLVSTTPRR